MPRIRQIKPEFYLDDDLAQCSRDARLLFPGLWILADRAVMRLTRRFPMPGELHEIASELWREAELRENSEHLDQLRAEWEQHNERG